MTSSTASTANASAGRNACTGLAGWFIDVAAASPEAEAVVFEDSRLTYRQLASRARAIAHQLSQLGINAGDKVGLLFPNGIDYVASFLAASGLGATVVPVNPLLKSEEIAHILRDSRAKCLIAHEGALDEVMRAKPEVPTLVNIVVAGAGARQNRASDQSSLLELTDGQEPSQAVAWPVPVEPDRDLALIVYTSGTTGKPKGAMLTFANMLCALKATHNAFRFGPQDRFLAVLPLCHIYGLTVVMLGILCRGGTLVILEKFEAAGAVSVLERERITVLPAVPAMYQFMLMELENRRLDLSGLRVCISGAASLPVEVLAKIEQVFGAPLIEGYGLTEVSCGATFNRLEGVRKVGSVGLPFDGVEVSIVSEDGRHLPSGRDNVGEIAIKGPIVMQGYYGRPDATSECIRDGWFFTGDLAYRDEDGYLFIVGRKKELIIRGGQNIYPREVEEVIARLPQVAEVAVIGVLDRYMGERVKAVVVARANVVLTEDEVKRFCAEHLADYKVPRLVEFVEALPRNSTGKVLKRLLAN